ncbi:hypothetical protein U1Q18_038266 [Sarracenia purpurea var. burkii]
MGARLSDFKKERLKVLLRQSVIALSQEVDEMLDPVLAIRQIESNLRCRKSLPNYSVAACEGDAEQHPHKKLKLSSSIGFPLDASPISGSISGEDSDYESKDADLPEKEISNGVKSSCAHYHTTETSNWRSVPEGHEVNNDLQFLLENDAIMVEESIKKHSDELSATLQKMEQQLEEILDIVLSNCRLMTLSEKQQLQKLIKKLPPRNLDRVVEIIRRNKPPGKYFFDEIHVDLEKEDNTTLWRLYFYVEAVDNARKLSSLLNLSHTFD